MGCFFLIINLKNKDRFKNSKLCGLWKLPYRHHGAIKFKQNWVFLSNLCINILVATSVTRQYHPKVLERLHLLQCISGHLQNTLPWASWKTQFLNLFRAYFRSCLVARSRKPIKCVLNILLRGPTLAVQIRTQKANVSSCNSQQWHPRRRGCGCLYNWYKPGLSTFFWRGRHRLLHNCSRASILRNMIVLGYVTVHYT